MLLVKNTLLIVLKLCFNKPLVLQFKLIGKKISNLGWNCKQSNCCNYKIPYVARRVDSKLKELDDMFICLGLRGTLFIEFKKYLNKNTGCCTLVVK